MSAKPDRTESLFTAAVQLPSDERAAYLDQECGPDKSLRQQLEGLLRAHDRASHMLDHPPAHQFPDLAATRETTPNLAGRTIAGRYKLLEEIGEGGMGTVWVAEQFEPVCRKVALKLIKLGMDSQSVLARFEAERQALAIMDHPNIAKVLDGGLTEAGRPYFVMEYVKGVPITEYCDTLRLSVAERLDLFVRVCSAIQHAHQKGIIHRDLKPSNILVAPYDDKPVPKVIDFGLAKALDRRLTERTLYTAHETIIGTPLYMSPEQAQLNNLDVDTRTDVYSLGVLLYELLTGTTPLEKARLTEFAWDEIRRIIREEEPLRPSTRLSTAGTLPSLAACRQTEPLKLTQQLRGELDWIVMKALEKDRTRRYETATGLSKDVQRYLAGEAVEACPPTLRYRLRKVFDKNRAAILTTGLVALVLVFSTIVSTWQSIRATLAKEATQLAQQEQSRLREEAEKSEAAEREQRVTAQAMELKARQMAYSSDMTLAQHMVAVGRLGRASTLLNRNRPLPGQLDLRGWEWGYLWQASRSDDHLDLCDLEHSIYSLSCSYDGKLVAVGGWESGGVSVWDLDARVQVQHWPSTDHHSLVAFSPVEPILAFSTVTRTANRVEGQVVLWDFDTNSPVAKLPLQGLCKGLIFAGNGRTLAAASANPNQRKRQDGQICVWQIPSGERVSCHAAAFYSNQEAIPFAAASDLSLAAYTVRHEIHLLDLATGEVLWKKLASQSTPVVALQFSPDGDMLASSGGFYDTSIRLWESRSGREMKQLQGHQGWIGDLVFWPDGKKLASSSSDETICIWDISDLDNVPSPRRLGGHRAEVWRAAMLSQGSGLVTGSNDGVVKIWDSSVAQTRKEQVVLPLNPVGFGIAEDSHSVLTVSAQGMVTEVSGNDFRRTETAMHLEKQVKGAKFWISDSDKRLAALTGDGAVEIYDLRRRECIRAIDVAARQLVDFSESGNRLLVIPEAEDTIEEWDLLTGLKRRSWEMPPSDSNLMTGDSVVSTDQRFLASARFSGELLFCDLVTGAEKTANLNTNQVHGISISPDNKVLAVATGLRVTKLFEIPAFRLIAELDGNALAMSFSRDGQRLAVTGAGGLRLWDVKARQELLTLDIEFSPQCEFSSDGSLLVARNWKKNLIIWQAPLPWEIDGGGGR